jgi:hypothetical protein
MKSRQTEAVGSGAANSKAANKSESTGMDLRQKVKQ